MLRPRAYVVLLAAVIGCGAGSESNRGSTGQPAAPIESSIDSPREARFDPPVGGPLVRMGSLVVPAGDVLVVEPGADEEGFVFIVDGELDGYPAGSALRVTGAARLSVVSEATLVGAMVKAEAPSEASVAAPTAPVVRNGESPILLNAGGKLRVQIFHDAASGAANGAFSLLDADADLSVPEHVHETSVEVLYIASGDGTMILGDARFAIAPGQVIYVPANTNHGYQSGSEPLRAFQVYAPPGPEQRFRGVPPAP